MDSKQKNNLLFISTEFPPGPGGIGNHAWNLARNLNKKISVDVLTVSNYSSKEECLAFDRSEKIKIIRFKKYYFSLLTYMHRMYTIVNKVKTDKYSFCIVSGYFSLLIVLLIRLINKEIIITSVLHGSELIQKNYIINYILSRSLKKINILISVSKYTNKLIPIKLVKGQKNVIIPNGVNHEMLISQSEIKRENEIIGTPCLLTVGSITNRKGQINLIKALPEIIQKYPNIHYHCVGLPIEKQNLVQLVDSLGLKNYVTLHGVVKNKDLGTFYKSADILIMLSQSNIDFCAEGFGIAILEANLFGTPALGSMNTGIEDAIVQYETGVLVNPYSSSDILVGIDKLLEENKQYSNNAKRWAIKHSWDNITKKYLEILMNA